MSVTGAPKTHLWLSLAWAALGTTSAWLMIRHNPLAGIGFMVLGLGFVFDAVRDSRARARAGLPRSRMPVFFITMGLLLILSGLMIALGI